MVASAAARNSSVRASWLFNHFASRDGDSPLSPPPHLQSPPSISGGGGDSGDESKISPAVLFIIIILAVIFFISGLLHLLVRFLIKKNPFNSSSPPHGRQQSHRYSPEPESSDALQRQLQQLFHLHDSGLDQASIDALPVFLYREVVGPKEPFDCAVCLCEFAGNDQLRLLPLCGHAFHLSCIDTWLLSNSTCPLCRGAVFVPGIPIDNPVFSLDDDHFFADDDGKPPPLPESASSETRFFAVRLGKFKKVTNEASSTDSAIGESSSSNLDARRCYSLGSYQYVVGKTDLRVSLSHKGGIRNRGNGEVTEEGKKLRAGNKGDSFSTSKIWLWSNKKGKLPISSEATSNDVALPWMRRRAENQ